MRLIGKYEKEVHQHSMSQMLRNDYGFEHAEVRRIVDFLDDEQIKLYKRDYTPKKGKPWQRIAILFAFPFAWLYAVTNWVRKGDMCIDKDTTIGRFYHQLWEATND